MERLKHFPNGVRRPSVNAEYLPTEITRVFYTYYDKYVAEFQRSYSAIFVVIINIYVRLCRKFLLFSRFKCVVYFISIFIYC